MDSFFKQKKSIYLAYRLFNFVDKLDVLELDWQIVKAISIKHNGDELPFYPVFLPYRDSLQHNDFGAMTWKKVYLADIERLKCAFGCVALMNGPSFDDGVVFELGYSVGLGLPTLVVSNDALVYHVGGKQYKVDMIIDSMVGKVISNIEMHGVLFKDGLFEGIDIQSEADKIVKSFHFSNTLGARFRERLTNMSKDCYLPVVNEVMTMIQRPKKYQWKRSPSRTRAQSIYIEFGGGKYQWQHILATSLSDDLRDSGYSDIAIGSRYMKSGSVKKDIEQLQKSEVVVVCVDGENVDPGVAFLMGYAKALNKPIVMYFSGQQVWSEPPVLPETPRNPMIYYSADHVVDDISDVVNVMKEIYV